MSEIRKDKTDRPFYELPAHIKPCSKIIQETRLQLSYGAKLGQSSPLGGGNSPTGAAKPPVSSTTANRYTSARHARRDPNVQAGGDGYDFSFDPGLYGDDAGGGPSFTNIRPVHTQRPKTGIEHDMSMLWGVSSRKRPPSAITLSRLSIDTSEEDDSPTIGATPLESVCENTESIASSVKTLTLGEKSARAKGQTAHTPLHSALESLRSLLSSTSGPASASSSSSTPSVGQGSNSKMHRSETIANLQEIKTNIHLLDIYPELNPKLLRTIFKLVEKNQQDEDLLFWASFVLLHCKIIGNNLTTVFKMVFKASRSKEYWKLMQETEYLQVFMESFAQICPITQTESMIYGYGTLKFICVEKSVLMHLVQLNLISMMTLHLKLLNYDRNSGKKAADSVLNGAFQLTSIFRTVVGEESTLPDVIASGLLAELVETLTWTTEDIDVLSNIVRILSVVSGSPICSQIISASSTFPASVVRIMELWYAKEDVIVRLSYTLGNLLAHSEHMRMKLFQQDGCYLKVLKLIHFYLERFNSPASEDILIKSIRILANWSLNPMIGSEIADTEDATDLLNVIIKNSDSQFSDELLMCTISTLNNISFYKDYEKSDCRTSLTAEYLINYLDWENQDGRVECMKVLGNLTRNAEIRNRVAQHVKQLIHCLETEIGQEERTVESTDALCAAVGVLMNVIVNENALSSFIDCRGIQFLLAILNSERDLTLQLMVCQFLWNVHVSAAETAREVIDPEMRLQIVKLINEKIRQMQENHNCAYEQLGELEYDELNFFDMRTEFISVASRLCEKLAC